MVSVEVPPPAVMVLVLARPVRVLVTGVAVMSLPRWPTTQVP